MRRQKALMGILDLCLLLFVLLLGCSAKGHVSTPGEQSTDSASVNNNGENDLSRTALFMTCAKQSVEHFVSDAKYSNDADDWTIIELDDGNTNISTHVTISGEDKLMNIIIELQDDEKTFITHFVSIGGEVYFDDLPEDY